MQPENRILREYILHRGDTGEGEGIALIWLDAECPLTGHATVSLAGPQGCDILIAEAGRLITLPAADEACLAIIRATKALHIIHQTPQGKPQSFKLALAQ
ncbi:hypothetical protein [Geopseudomonas aromaticivorans]